MARKKAETETWPRAWANNAPAYVGYNEETFEEVADRHELVDDDETFHLGQVYEDEAAKLLRCISCGGTQFNVGQGSYFTVIRCPACGWEESIHDG